MKILRGKLLLGLLTTFLLLFSTNIVEAKVMWGKTELKKGQIGKVTVLQNTVLYLEGNSGNFKTGRKLLKGEEYRVYRFISNNNGMYGLGGGVFVKKDSAIKYETPSKRKLALLEAESNPTKPQKPTDSINTEYTILSSQIEGLSTDITKGISQKEFALRSGQISDKIDNYPSNKLDKLELQEKFKKMMELPKIEFKQIVFEFSDGQRITDYNNTNFGNNPMNMNFQFENKIYLAKYNWEKIHNVANGFYTFSQGKIYQSGTLFTEEIIQEGNQSYTVYKLLNPVNKNQLIIENRRKPNGIQSWDNFSPYSIEDGINTLELDVTYSYDKNNHVLTFIIPKPLKQ